ncbi:MAG: alpha/beta hydrolase family protein, partial [Kordiimonas sp.]
DDVTDATYWLIENEFADKERICIAGASYGGYASLMGTIKEPDLYQCAISVNGVTNLPKLKSQDKFTTIGGRDWTKTMGLKGVDDEDVSPHHRAEEINIPVLLISSKDDARIPYTHTKDTHSKLKRLKKDSHYVKLDNGTHHMLTAESRLVTLRETEKFLAKHIGN